MKKAVYILAQEVFKVMLVGNMVFLVMELIKPGSVWPFLNIIFWLIIWLASAIIIVIFKVKPKAKM